MADGRLMTEGTLRDRRKIGRQDVGGGRDVSSRRDVGGGRDGGGQKEDWPKVHHTTTLQ